jgi:hypothetical protein
MKEDHGEEEEVRRKSNNGINENNIVAVNMLAAFQKGESMEAKFRFELGRSTINMDKLCCHCSKRVSLAECYYRIRS